MNTTMPQTDIVFIVVRDIMTRAKIPDRCDICGLDIKSETQYMFEVYQGRSSFGKERIKGSNMDCCHKCFLDIAKQGYEPNWKHSIKNVNYVKGGKEPYWLDKPQIETQTLDITKEIAA